MAYYRHISFCGALTASGNAPDLQPPVRVVVESTSQSETNITTSTSTPPTINKTGTPETSSVAPSASTESDADPFKGLADAFAKLAEDQSSKSSAPMPPETIADINDEVRGALVNIICVTETSGPFNSISASGVIIDSRGVILTNSHVAQYFLLENYPRKGFVTCTVRTGSPAQPMYTAELLFLPPSWIKANAQKIDDEHPTGNGEHDYALVRITGTVNKNITLPASFPALSVSLGTPDTGDSVVVAGYPAGFLGGITVAKDLFAASAEATVGQLYTFGSQSIDLFSIGGTVVAQQGSSGGAVADGNGNLVGVIVTSSDAPDTASRDLRALATPYIVNDFEKESGISLSNYLSANLAERALAYRFSVAPALTEALVDVLKN